MPDSVEFFYDFISPNAYLAWQPLRDIAARHELSLILRPVLFAGLLQAHGQVGPAEVAPKMHWMVRNCIRKANKLGVALAPPHSHPFNPLLALRVTLASGSDAIERVTDALFRAIWTQACDVSDIAEVSAVLSATGLDATTIVAAAGSDAVKTRLRTETDLAIARGVFGVPTMIVDQELFFGFDDLPWLECFLRGEDMLDRRKYTDWLDIRPTVWRKRQ